MPKPICFMIMPYGRKPTQVEPSSSVPGEIDFNALWDRALLNDDEHRAAIVAQVVLTACERAEKLSAEVRSKAAERWKLKSTIEDLELSAAQVEDKDKDKDTKDRLVEILGSLEAVVA